MAASSEGATGHQTTGEDYGAQFVRGSMWTIGARWAMRLIGLVSTMILARLLAPEDFGLIAMIMLAYGLLETISYAGVDLALMRSGADSREHFDTAWTLQIAQGIFIACCLVLVAPWIAEYFKEPRLVLLIWCVAPRAVIDSLQNIGVVAFSKELDFATEFRFSVYNKLTVFATVVPAALVLRNYWALIFGSLAASIVGVVISYAMHPYRPRLSLARFGEIWSFSQWLMISRVGSFLNRKCDEFIVGGQVGTAPMGSYHVANELATLPTSELVMPIRRAMYPSLSKMTDRPEEFQRVTLTSFSAIAALCLFVGFCLAVVAAEFTAVALGPKWTNAVPLIQALAVFGASSALVLVLEVPLWVDGKTNLSAAQSWLELALIAPLILLAVRHYGVEGAAIARAGVSALMVPVMLLLVARTRRVSLGQLLGSLWRPLVAATAMALAVSPWSISTDSALLALLVKTTLCFGVFVSVLLVLWRLAGRPEGFERAAFDQIMAMRLRLLRARRRFG